VSAREELYATLMRGGPHSPDRSEKASMLLDAYAHELAEKQRARANASAMMRSERMQGIAQGLRIGADLIDPEVLNSDVQPS
jgi:hypothetical protein